MQNSWSVTEIKQDNVERCGRPCQFQCKFHQSTILVDTTPDTAAIRDIFRGDDFCTAITDREDYLWPWPGSRIRIGFGDYLWHRNHGHWRLPLTSQPLADIQSAKTMGQPISFTAMWVTMWLSLTAKTLVMAKDMVQLPPPPPSPPAPSPPPPSPPPPPRPTWRPDTWMGAATAVTTEAGAGVAGIAQWLERRAHDRTAAAGFRESRQEWLGNLLLQGQLSVLTLISVYSVHPRVTAVACKRSRSFCQTCRWQVTAKHACTLRSTRWRDTVHGCMVYTELAETAAVSRGSSHVTTK